MDILVDNLDGQDAAHNLKVPNPKCHCHVVVHKQV